MSTNDSTTAATIDRPFDCVLPMLSDDVRQAIVTYLAGTERAVSIDDLLDHLVHQTGSSGDHLSVQLRHVHLPKLAAQDLVVHDVTANTVRAGENTKAADGLFDVVDDYVTQ